jgi:hypothetical protein
LLPVVSILRIEAGEAGSVDNWTSWYNVGVTADRAILQLYVGRKVVKLLLI